MEKLSVRSFIALKGYENSAKILICITVGDAFHNNIFSPTNPPNYKF